jgi:peroxiredoxin Q/BCP
MLNVGDYAEDFSLNDANGNLVNLQALLEQGELVVYFYPADFTPGCTAEACQIRDIHGEIEEVGIRVIGISPQSEASHQRFASRYELPFTLLCDSDKKVIRAFGVDGPLGFGVRRATFLVGQDRQIKRRVVADLMIGSHISFIRKIIQSQSDAGDPN